MVFKECVGELCAAHGGPVGVSSGTPGVEVHGLLYLGDFVHYYAGAAEVIFEQELGSDSNLIKIPSSASLETKA